MPKVLCYGMYGLTGGPFPYGFYYSAGLDVLGKKIRALGPHIEVLPTFGFSEWKTIVDDAKRQPEETRIVIYGHSMGANLAAAAANRLGSRPVDLLVAFDPTIWYPSESLGANVRRAIWVHGTNIFSPFGHGRLNPGADFRGEFKRIDVGDRHELIDDNEKLHAIVLEAVRALAE
jgi:alpha-beta hydrolase superfamily lysophospholipase